MLNITGDSGNSDCDGSGQPLWWLGVLLGLLGSIFINTGNNLQSLGMHDLAEKEEAQRSSKNINEVVVVTDPMNSTTWRVGTFVFVSGALLNFVSYAFAAQSMLASLEAIQFVTNIFFSKFFLKKEISYKMYGGTLMICLGTIIAVAFSSKTELCASATDLIRNYTRNVAYQIYLAFTVVFAISLQAIHVTYQKYVDAGTPLPGSNTVLPVSYAAFSAIFGTQSVVQAKCLAELLEANSPTIYPVFLHWFTYAALAAWLALVAVWLFRMNEALSLYDPIFIIPLLQTDFILLAIIAGGIYFREFNDFTTSMWIGFVSGMCIVFIGLFMLAPGNDQLIEPRTPSAKVAPEPQLSKDLTAKDSDKNSSIQPTNHDDRRPKPAVAPTHMTNTELSHDATEDKQDTLSPVRITRTLSPVSNDIPPALDPVQVPSEQDIETPRSKSLDAPIRKRRQPPRIAKTPLNFVTSISAQYNINELDSARSSRSSFDRRRPEHRRASLEVTRPSHPKTLREEAEENSLDDSQIPTRSPLKDANEARQVPPRTTHETQTQEDQDRNHQACLQTI